MLSRDSSGNHLQLGKGDFFFFFGVLVESGEKCVSPLLEMETAQQLQLFIRSQLRIYPSQCDACFISRSYHR